MIEINHICNIFLSIIFSSFFLLIFRYGFKAGIINKVLQVVARKVLGKDCTFEIEFALLRTVSPVDKQKINNSKLQNIYKSYFIGFITAKEACKQINKENLLGFRIEEKDIISPDTELAKILVRDNL